MKRLLLPLIAAVVLPFAFNNESKAFFNKKEDCSSYKYSSSKLFKSKVTSVVVISSDKSQGSGFIVKHDKRHTFILTNAHVVGDKKRVNIKWSDGEEDNAEVVGNLGGDRLDNDVALLKVFGIKGIPNTFDDNLPEIGADAVVIGAPNGLEFSLTRGVVSQVRENGKFVQIDAPVNPGNSGGPVFNHAGCVIGIVTFKANDSSEGLNFAIGNNIIDKFLKNPIMDQEAIARANTSNDDKSISSYIELWNGIHTGMNVDQVKQKFSGDVECSKSDLFSWVDIDVFCKTNKPQFSIGDLNFVVNVLFQGDTSINDKKYLKEVNLVSLDHFYCPDPGFDYENCSSFNISQQERRDQLNLLKIRDVIRRRFGQEEKEMWQGTVSQRNWYGRGKKIELIWNSTGVIVVKYKVDESSNF